MAGNLQPLDMQFPIVDQQGRPTLYFIKWAQQRQIDIGTAAVLIGGNDFSGDQNIDGNLTVDPAFIASFGNVFMRGKDASSYPSLNFFNYLGLPTFNIAAGPPSDPKVYWDADRVDFSNLDESILIFTLTTPVSTFRVPLEVPDEVYGAGWDGSLQVPTKNAVYDKIQSMSGGGGGSIYNPITNVPTTAAFTLLQGVAGSAVMANLSNSRGVSLAVTGAGAVDRNATLEVNTPGATWTMTTVLLPNVLSRNFVTYGLYVKDSATGRIQAFCLGVSGASYSRRLNWNSLTSFSGATDQAGFGPEGVGPVWLKLVLDATNLTFFISADSETYVQLFQNAKFSFPATINRCGVWLGINQQTAPTGMAEAISVLSFNVV